MALKFKLKSKDEIPAEFQSLYAERDGAFVLDVDGAADKSKLDEARTNNVALVKQLDDLKKKFEGIDEAGATVEEGPGSGAVVDGRARRLRRFIHPIH